MLSFVESYRSPGSTSDFEAMTATFRVIPIQSSPRDRSGLSVSVLTMIHKLAISSALAAVLVSAPAPHSIDLNFQETVIGVGKGPGPMAVADINHDGKPDIMVANIEDGTISVLLGDEKGRFSLAFGSPFPCGKNPSDIAVADMNGDGNPDLVIVNTQTPYITILMGNGKGRFQPSAH